MLGHKVINNQCGIIWKFEMKRKIPHSLASNTLVPPSTSLNAKPSRPSARRSWLPLPCLP
uniref:Uncharacterized protein n=1 Tax=Oryzias sinensis TaxID=183150 RepID=A0A8C7Z048_9TELE